MNTKSTNPFLKQLISEIANKSNEGRITDINWVTLAEAKKKKKVLKKEASAPAPKKKPAPTELPEEPKDEAPTEEPAAPAAPEAAPSEAPDAPGAEAPESAPEPDLGGDVGGEEAAPEASPEETEDAQADANKAKAELEKAKAEKDKAEKEIKQQSYIKLGSNAGTQFLMGKLLGHAFKTNTIDALAGEMVSKLKIQTPEDLNSFGEDTAAFRVLPGFPELLSSMKTLATKQPESSEDEPLA